jgi:aspartate aminotransferase-like enzyme/phosphatidylglycerophosphate synthase
MSDVVAESYPPLYTPFKWLSGRAARLLIDTPVTSNALTLLWGGLLTLSGYALAIDARIAAFALVLIAVFLDCLDGDLARARRQSSDAGTLLEQVAHWVGNMAIAAGAGTAVYVFSPGPYTFFLLPAMCVTQAVYVAVVRQLPSSMFSSGGVQRARRLLFVVARINYLLAPIELPLVAFFLVFGLSTVTLSIAFGFLLVSSMLIFCPHFLIVQARDRRAWEVAASRDFPEVAVREAERVLAAFAKRPTWYAPEVAKLAPQVQRMSAAQPLYRGSAEFQQMSRDLREDLPRLFRTDGCVITTAGSGAAMAAAVHSVLAPDDAVVVLVGGPQGWLWTRIATEAGAHVRELQIPFGQPVDLDALERAIACLGSVKAVVATLSEPAHGGVHDIAAIGERVRAAGALFVVDVIHGLAADDFHMDDWGVDIAVGASDSGLMAPPGIGLIALSRPVIDRFQGVATTATLACDERDALACNDRQPSGVPTQLVAALSLSTRMILSVGLDRYVQHRRDIAWGFRRGCREVLGLPLVAVRPSAACTTVKLPAGIRAEELLTSLREKHGIAIVSGETPGGEETLQIGHAGWIFRDDIFAVVQSLALCLYQLGHAPGQKEQDVLSVS